MANLIVKSTDRVFQVSLTEIAFTLIFILLLLLGGLLSKYETENKKLSERLAAAASAASIMQMLDERVPEIIKQLSTAGLTKPDEVVSALSREASARQEAQELRVKVDDLNAQVSSLVEVKKIVEKLVEGKTGSEQVQAALLFKDAFEKAAGQHVESGQEKRVAQRVGEIARQALADNGQAGKPIEFAKENADLRGQVAFLKGKLDARGGRDYPPCWADEATGKVQYLFTVDIRENGVTVAAAWPSSRDSDARALPGISGALGEQAVQLEEFKRVMQGIFEESKRKNCRHYVYMKNSVKDLNTFNRYRYGIENIFYKLELRS